MNEYIKKKIMESFEFDSNIDIKLICEKMHREDAYVNYKHVANCIMVINTLPFFVEYTEYNGKTTISIKFHDNELMGVIRNE